MGYSSFLLAIELTLDRVRKKIMFVLLFAELLYYDYFVSSHVFIMGYDVNADFVLHCIH